jgi:hypothetical protein
MLAFYSVLLSAVTVIRDVALSNESSANEPTIPGTYINHQYSKSLEFETDFRDYFHDMAVLFKEHVILMMISI